ncbi:cytochrome d ubiquinol oxidase subunit I [Actinoalloteichus hoggarensis]|uniref:Cytochrome bd ubiquinol oxidase subunit 1 n=1 Tax=Actinoalloteichus hoggarensis TaxID=1470176 RepID=A0A221W8D5_9PSEU|nr:cytochrome ubiquinol oxidase subunit I [Actinoalloteichus hoggarensis]ASO21856.1 Cytochrome bd ubiquinol oxidase subunit 1 [Actinoalloteichus hoggarensis]MBB5922454.1 cytochrome d ubiquinol oxidase subunit I [Actinoalloteichus hoggarensis]
MNAETLELARLQFALTAGAHFLFVALTLGLATIVACIQTRATFSRSEVHARMTRFWGQLYVINYAVGIVTGLVMEFQFGMSWSGLTHFAGNVFGASLAMETLVAFFIESTFLGLWIFGWHRLNRWAHLALIWIVTLTAYASAYWILVSNGFLQNPVGYRVDGDTLVLTDLGALLTNHSTILPFWHILGGALVTASFFMAGISAFHLFRRTPEQEFFRRSLRIGVATSLPALMFTASVGGFQFGPTGESQPMKIAAYTRDHAEMDRLQAEMVAQFGPGDYLPPVAWVQGGAITMLGVFGLMLMLSGASFLLMWFRPVVLRFRLWHLLLIAAIPMPFIAMIAGWVFREMGRQPWVVTGLLRVEDAVSPVSSGAMLASLITFSVLFGVLILVNYWLLARQAARGPDEVALGRPEAETRPEPAPTATF